MNYNNKDTILIWKCLVLPVCTIAAHVSLTLWAIPFALGWSGDTHARIMKPFIRALKQKKIQIKYSQTTEKLSDTLYLYHYL